MSDALDSLKRQFDKIAGEKNQAMLAYRDANPGTDDRSQAWMDCYYCFPNSTQAATLVKRIKALEKEQPVLAGLLMPVADRLLLKQSEIAVQKGADLKNRNARKEAAAAKKADAAETKADPYRKLHPQVAVLLREVAEPYRIKAVEYKTALEANVLAEIKKLAGMYDSFAPDQMFPMSASPGSWERTAIINKRVQARDYVVNSGDFYTPAWALAPDADGIVQRKAERFAEDMVAQFVHKVGTKLSGVVERKGNLDKTSITGSLQDHWMTFTFTDGSSFQVQSQIVWKVSVNGLHFAQFPTCFRRVVLANGTKMELPSEVKMKKEFV